MQTWVVDIGNTKCAFARVERGELTTRFTVPTSELGEVPFDLIESYSRVVIGSVVPGATERLLARLDRLTATTLVIHSADIPLTNEYLEIEKLGTDRILAAYAAHELYGKPESKNVVVVSLGTATTFECVTKEGVYLGGAITIGIGSVIDAIHERTAQLPKVPMDLPKSAIGRTTMESLQSGILNTQLLGIREFTHTLAAEAFPTDKPAIVATGGLAQFTHTHMPGLFDVVDPDLVLKGLAIMSQERGARD